MADERWTDEPIRASGGDSLGRLPYAQRAADLISTTHSFDTSAVFGLSGPWGSGKTSLVNMIVEELVTAHPQWKVARFTPWATSDTSGLLAEFYASLAEVLPKKKGQQVRRALAATASVAAPAAHLIPVAGGVAAEGVRTAGEALARTPSWQVAFSRASKELRELKTPILVVVDDIDRLHGDELMALLKVVRLLGRFDGVQYLLAYDDDTLRRSMATSSAITPNDGTARRFMEKIVQYPLFVPPLLRHQQLSRLNAGLASTSREEVDDGVSERRLNGLVDCFVSLLTTPRAIDRYIAQLRHHIPLLPPEEVDDEDVQLLTLIRVCFPALFNVLPRYRARLISGHTGVMDPSSQPMTYEPFDIAPLMALVPAEDVDLARQLLLSLFPKLHRKGDPHAYPSHRRQSVQNEEYFDRYFVMGILEHDVSDVRVATAVAAASRGDAAPLTALLSDEGLGLVLSKGLAPSNQPSTNAGRVQLAAVLVSVANDLPSDDTGPFSDQDLVLTWIADLLVALDRETPAATVLSVIELLAGQSVRIRAWRRVENALERAHGAPAPAWAGQVTAHLARDAADDFLHHLQQGDDVAATAGVGYQVHFALRHDADHLRDRIRALLESRQVHLSDLASRLVSARTLMGIKPDWQLSADFDQDTFNQLAPAGDDPWYEEAVQEVDVRDLSWANRRRFVAGRVAPPPSPADSSEPARVAPRRAGAVLADSEGST